MSDAAETKPDPTTQAPEAEKPETTATGEGEKSVTEAAADTAKQAADTSKDAAAKTSDSVFSMFGGGPKKEKKEETDEGADEPSGSSKAKKEGEVSFTFPMMDGYGYESWPRDMNGYQSTAGAGYRSVPASGVVTTFFDEPLQIARSCSVSSY